MFGFIRLGLAIAVVLSHLGVRIGGENPGVFAVVIFFILSGYATTGIFTSANQNWRTYYLERGIRIFPSYLVILALSLFIVYALAPRSYFLSKTAGVLDLISNIVIIPLNLYRWTGQDRFTVVPPAWSLALELQYYAVVPIIFNRRGVEITFIMLLSFFVWITANQQLIDSDLWGYRMLPGTLFIFIIGLVMHRNSPCIIFVVLISIGIYLSMVLLKMISAVDFNVEEAFGIATGIALVAMFSRLQTNSIDRFMGGLSYPLFLVHFDIIYLLESFGVDSRQLSQPCNIAMCLGGSLILSWFIYELVEKPVRRRRRTLLNKRNDNRLYLKNKL